MDQDETWHAGRPRPRPHCVRWGPSSTHGKGHNSPPLSKFTGAGFACVRIIRGPCLLWPNGWMCQDETWRGGRPQLWPNWVGWGPSSPSSKGAHPPLFDPCLLWPNGWMDHDATWYEGRTRPRPHCVRWGPALPPPKGVHVYCGQTVAHLGYC